MPIITNQNNILDSKIISLLRFPLMVLVVCIHGQFFLPELKIQYPFFYNIQYFISSIVAKSAVPLFFVFSGYLYFNLSSTFNRKIYLLKTKSRLHTLLIPYLICNTLFIIYTFITDRHNTSDNFDLVTFIKSYWVIDGTNPEEQYPALFPLWFLRDLIVINLITPIIWYLSKKLKTIFLILVFLFCFAPISTIPFMNKFGFLCFTIGSYLSIHQISFSKTINRVSIVILMILFAIFTISVMSIQEKYFVLNQFLLLINCMLVLRVSSYFILHKNLEFPKWLSQTSFFLYLYHVPLIGFFLRKLYYTLPHNDLMFTLIFFSCIFITIVICTITFFILKRIAPRFLNIITGKRI